MRGLGEKFVPDLFTGAGNFTIPISLPPGRNSFEPRLNLVYSTGNGNGVFGLGWSLSLPAMSRRVSHGIPRYNEGAAQPSDEPVDVFVLAGAEDLVPVAGSYPGTTQYRPRTEGLFAQITHARTTSDNFWELKDKDGLISRFGTASAVDGDPAVLRDPAQPARIFSWKISQTSDPFGNVIQFDYERDDGSFDNHVWDQPLLKRIRYADYGDPANPNFLVYVLFEYEERPDLFSDYRAGFEIRTTRRCRAIRIRTREYDGTEHDVREYRFSYSPDPSNGVSLLTSFSLLGFDDDGASSSELPPLSFETGFAPARQRFEPVIGRDLPARVLADPTFEFVDLHGGGLPDILEMNGATRFWRNLGGGRFDLARPMAHAPTHALGDAGVKLSRSAARAQDRR
jgi:Salmonella virulence plasmid 65kDa B protein